MPAVAITVTVTVIVMVTFLSTVMVTVMVKESVANLDVQLAATGMECVEGSVLWLGFGLGQFLQGRCG